MTESHRCCDKKGVPGLEDVVGVEIFVCQMHMQGVVDWLPKHNTGIAYIRLCSQDAEVGGDFT